MVHALPPSCHHTDRAISVVPAAQDLQVQSLKDNDKALRDLLRNSDKRLRDTETQLEVCIPFHPQPPSVPLEPLNNGALCYMATNSHLLFMRDRA